MRGTYEAHKSKKHLKMKEARLWYLVHSSGFECKGPCSQILTHMLQEVEVTERTESMKGPTVTGELKPVERTHESCNTSPMTKGHCF